LEEVQWLLPCWIGLIITGVLGYESWPSSSHALSCKIAGAKSQVSSPVLTLTNFRVNAILPGLLLSECTLLVCYANSGGLKYGDETIEAYKQLAPLKQATEMDDCADAYVMMAKNGKYNALSLIVK
jgi:hypothetical protein